MVYCSSVLEMNVTAQHYDSALSSYSLLLFFVCYKLVSIFMLRYPLIFYFSFIKRKETKKVNNLFEAVWLGFSQFMVASKLLKKKKIDHMKKIFKSCGFLNLFGR